jgi:hypothetical protein
MNKQQSRYQWNQQSGVYVPLEGQIGIGSGNYQQRQVISDAAYFPNVEYRLPRGRSDNFYTSSFASWIRYHVGGLAWLPVCWVLAFAWSVYGAGLVSDQAVVCGLVLGTLVYALLFAGLRRFGGGYV